MATYELESDPYFDQCVRVDGNRREYLSAEMCVDELNDLQAEIERLRADRDEYKQLLDMQHERVQVADAEYVAANPRDDCPYGYKPDLGTLVRWLRAERDEAREAAMFLLENAEDVAAGRVFGLEQGWPWLDGQEAGEDE